MAGLRGPRKRKFPGLLATVVSRRTATETVTANQKPPLHLLGRRNPLCPKVDGLTPRRATTACGRILRPSNYTESFTPKRTSKRIRMIPCRGPRFPRGQMPRPRSLPGPPKRTVTAIPNSQASVMGTAMQMVTGKKTEMAITTTPRVTSPVRTLSD